MDKNNFVGAVLIDLKKAFDTVDHKILLKKLWCYGFQNQSFDWFESYLTDRQQLTLVNNIMSDLLQEDVYGVPQGSVLGPLLFLLYIDDIKSVIQNAYCHLYADDTIILKGASDPDSLIASLERELSNVDHWLSINKMTINTTINNGTEHRITIFNQDSLRKCQDILKIRKRNKLKYHDQVALPTIQDSFHGYHMSCYRRFVALSQSQRSRIESAAKEKEPEITRLTRASSDIINGSSSAGIFKPVCLFCQQSRKRLKGVQQKLVSVETKEFEKNIKKYTEWKNDENMLRAITSVDFVAKEVKYHSSCRITYQRESEVMHKKTSGQENNVKSQWHKDRETYNTAFEIMAAYVKDKIINQKQVLLLTTLIRFYQAVLQDVGGHECGDASKGNSSYFEKSYLKC